MEAKEILFGKGQKSFIEGRPEESVGYFTSAIDSGYDTDVSLLSRGVAYFRLKDYDNAIKDFSCIIDTAKRKDRVYYYRGISYIEKEVFTNAVSDLSEAIGINPENAHLYMARAISFSKLGEHEKADKDFKEALMLSEVNIQGFADSNNILRTQFDKVLAIYEGDSRPYTISLTDEEIDSLKKFVTE